MRVKYAAQIFSHTVSEAIKTASITKEVNSVTALDTADFIENINDIFDALNSRVLHDSNPKRRPNRGGYNPTPTVRQCRIAIQQNMNIRLQMAEGTGNCKIDEIEILEIDTQETNSSDQEVCVTSEVPVFFIQKKFNCELCASYLIKDSNDLVEKNKLFMLYKDYSCENDIRFLKRPSDQFVQIVLSLLKLFNEAFNKYKCSSKVTETIEHYLKAYLERSTDWFELNGSASCIHHKEYLLKLFIKIKLFRQLKWESNQLSVTVRESSNKPRKPRRKVRILS
ncbi:hypothetical protein ILUMI_13596 [Ignelater luminosus]|uniref:Transposable element P transposase-like GTP-binding insertion domain-containing protein n=1 Tax=Ignelater luminosus TaxID=2038154 RepID=A0A8K0CWF1_IGNLU|nr:hypothetical protein ILUMI_13596 [Ignelater luminosus]